MDHAAPVGERERVGQLGGDPGRGHGRQRPLLAHDLAQRATFDVLHHDVVGAPLLPPVVHRADVGVVQAGRVLGLPPEPLDEARVAGELGEEHLDRDVPAELAVDGEVDVGHPPPGQLPLDLVPVGDDRPYLRHLAHNATGGPGSVRGTDPGDRT